MNKGMRIVVLFSLALFITLLLQADILRADSNDKEVTLILLSDVHGHLEAHAEIFPGNNIEPESGGLAKLATEIQDIRNNEPSSLLLMVGDATHGGAEVMFTLGDAIMPAFNALGIDAFTPGNWDFGYGPRVFRTRFAGATLPLAPNNRTTLGCPPPGQGACDIIPANFPSVAINLYNFDEATKTRGGRVLPPYIIRDVDGLKVALIGITSDNIPQQADVFNIGLAFTNGFAELPGIVNQAKAEGAELIVVMSELGLGKNIQLAREFPEIHVILSAHTHEITPDPIVIDHGNDDITIVVEAGEDTFLGRLEARLRDGEIDNFNWDLVEVDGGTNEDPALKALVDEARKTFVAGPDFQCHTFGPAGFAFGQGHTECSPLETVIGTTQVTLKRANVFEEISQNFIADAFLEAINTSGGSNFDIFGTTIGFRFDIVILGQGTPLSNGETATGEITVGDLYHYFPIVPAVATTEFAGGGLIQSFEEILAATFDPNPYRQRGGWWSGFSNNVRMTIELQDTPLAPTSGRLLEATINGQAIDPSKAYETACFYPHGDSLDRNCRTRGGRNLRLLTGTQNPDGTVSTPFSLSAPLNTEAILDPLGPSQNPPRPVVLQVAPNNYVAPIAVLREFLKTHVITASEFSAGRMTAVPGVPVSDFDPDLIQPVQGAGPVWLGR